MTLQSEINGETTRVRFSLAQFWAIIVALVASGFVVGGGLHMIRSDLAALTTAQREMKAERAESLRDWSRWREEKNRSDAQQDFRITVLESTRPGGR